MNVLVLGSGGREHALSWRLAQDQSCTQVYAWPGNPGMMDSKIKLVSLSFNKLHLQQFLRDHKISLVVPGAEKFLYEGVANWCEEWNVPCFGPDTKAAMLEKSKLFSKMIMTEAGIPTASYRDLTHSLQNDLKSAEEIVSQFKKPVIKISGPSLGKGVFVCKNPAEAVEVLRQLRNEPMAGMEEGVFVEEGVSGKEVSLFYACHGENYQFLGAAQDHKRLLDDDQGPNTGGMGTLSPVKWANDQFIAEATRIFLEPTLKRMNETGCPFKGVLFLGLMVDGKEMNLLEYNVRFGDPETQVLLPLLEGDFTDVLYSFAVGAKTPKTLSLKPHVAVHVVKAAKGYPGLFGTSVEKGQKISLNTLSKSAKAFFAGVKKDGSHLLTDGGRVLGITAWGQDKEEARAHAYENLARITFEGEQYRKDIGSKE
jgi:phosphoribosylamine--glycine ligase